MAVSKDSKILASDISGAIKSITRSGTTFTYTTVSGDTGTFTQQDNNTTYSAGTGLSLSSNKFSIANSGVTAGNYGPSANATPAYGATFNVPYISVDATGRVTAASTKTVKIPAAPSSASVIPNVVAGNPSGSSFTLPTGGTWRYLAFTHNDVYVYSPTGSSASGGTTISLPEKYPKNIIYIAIRVA